MITEKDLNEAIAECKSARSPNANTCMKLASYYTILDHIQEPGMPGYSTSAGTYQSDSEFGKAVQKAGMEKTMKVMEELMSTLKMVNPRLYNSVLREMES